MTNLSNDEPAHYLVLSPNIGGTYCDVISANLQPTGEFSTLKFPFFNHPAITTYKPNYAPWRHREEAPKEVNTPPLFAARKILLNGHWAYSQTEVSQFSALRFVHFQILVMCEFRAHVRSVFLTGRIWTQRVQFHPKSRETASPRDWERRPKNSCVYQIWIDISREFRELFLTTIWVEESFEPRSGWVLIYSKTVLKCSRKNAQSESCWHFGNEMDLLCRTPLPHARR